TSSCSTWLRSRPTRRCFWLKCRSRWFPGRLTKAMADPHETPVDAHDDAHAADAHAHDAGHSGAHDAHGGHGDPLDAGHLIGHVKDATYFEFPRFMGGKVEIPQIYEGPTLATISVGFKPIDDRIMPV